MLSRLLVATLGIVLLAARASGADPVPISRYDRADIAPTKTSIYIGSVSMTMPTFVRRQGAFESTYTARVFPYFFYNESGRLSIRISDETLRRLEHGEVIQFEGEGVSSDGQTRHIEGRAIPADAANGKIKVRVFVSKRIQLIFNTTYRFPDRSP